MMEDPLAACRVLSVFHISFEYYMNEFVAVVK